MSPPLAVVPNAIGRIRIVIVLDTERCHDQRVHEMHLYTQGGSVTPTIPSPAHQVHQAGVERSHNDAIIVALVLGH